MKKLADVEVIDFDDRVVVLADSTRLPITNLIAKGGEDMEWDEDLDNLASLVAGTDEQGWLSIDIKEFRKVSIH